MKRLIAKPHLLVVITFHHGAAQVGKAEGCGAVCFEQGSECASGGGGVVDADASHSGGVHFEVFYAETPKAVLG
jgi:hypothetical protein